VAGSEEGVAGSSKIPVMTKTSRSRLFKGSVIVVSVKVFAADSVS